MQRYRSALWKALVVLLACACASYVTIANKGRGFGFQLSVQGGTPATAQTRSDRGHRPRRERDPNYDLTRMVALRFALLEISNSYVDPARIHPRQMLLKGLEAIQRSVAQVLVRHEENSRQVTVVVDTAEHVFEIGDVDSPWKLQTRWREIFQFLQQHLRSQEEVDLQAVEYAAANGMLHTLDPHSILLTPEQFYDMRIQNGGAFGGLGIVISLRDGLLTVMNTMPNAPATRSGVRRFDRIMRINSESTLNMTLSEAVNRLRGEPDTNVDVWIRRDGEGGFREPRRFTLTRAEIHVESVESRMLAQNVGYARIKNFAEETSAELTRALTRMREQGMRSLILDMRGNPGGFLDQAVEVSDLFLRNGAIVVTAGNRREGRDQRDAVEAGTEPNYPMVVLIDGGSASASEIVAGALKNNNRALIVGQQSFGKGSVQTIRPVGDGGALKITINQYLTPGDVSIQGVGITPDIELRPMTVDALDMDLEADRAYVREADLTAHLTSNRTRDMGAAAETLQYFFSSEDRERLRINGPDEEDSARREDFWLRFGRELLSSQIRPTRLEGLADARPHIARIRQAELESVARALAAMPQHIDWADGPNRAGAQLEVTSALSRPTGTPGEPLDLTVTVTNRGTSPVYRLRANTKSDNPLFENRELVFGRVDPGQSRVWTAPLGLCQIEGFRFGSSTHPPPNARRVCNVPLGSLSRVDGIRFEWSESHNHVPATATPVRAEVRGLERPSYAYGWQFADNLQGNGDGRLQRGERGTLYFTMRNIGRGRGYETQVNLKNLSGQGVILADGRFSFRQVATNEERQMAFTFSVENDFRSTERAIKLEVTIEDEDLREVVTQRILLPLADAQPVAAASGFFIAGATTQAFESSGADVRPVARLGAGQRVAITGRAGDWLRVELARNHPAWVRRGEAGAALPSARPMAWVMHNEPPVIETALGQTLAVREASVHLAGLIRDEARVLDYYVFVGNRKVIYRSNRSGTDPRSIAMDADLPLRPGSNLVSIIAREDSDTVARRGFVIRRDGPNGELLATPRAGEAEAEQEDD
ncbi:MAG: MXAN_5808 family serine peptidase [Deltaproteobacteria bacterium]|nr:MXAN_5808 family serine peptidase [Deltaproteobacteria bacterium]